MIFPFHLTCPCVSATRTPAILQGLLQAGFLCNHLGGEGQVDGERDVLVDFLPLEEASHLVETLNGQRKTQA